MKDRDRQVYRERCSLLARRFLSARFTTDGIDAACAAPPWGGWLVVSGDPLIGRLLYAGFQV
jgi:hypothetical protein